MTTIFRGKADEEINKLTDKIIGCAYTVSNNLGAGFLEKVYENALAHELQKCGLKASQQQQIPVYYDGVMVGDYYADLLVNDRVIIELKTARALDDAHAAQCMNYLKATNLYICLLINFAHSRIDIRRIINPALK